MTAPTRTFKQYLQTRPQHILAFMRTERQLHGESALGEYASLSPADFTNEVLYFLHSGERRVGFIGLRSPKPGQPRELTKLYIAPNHRRQGMGQYALNALRVELIRVPLKVPGMSGLCRAVGFRFDSKQPYPATLAVMVRNY